MLRPEELSDDRCDAIALALIRRHKLVYVDRDAPAGLLAWPLAAIDAALEVAHLVAPTVAPSAGEFRLHWGFTAGPFVTLARAARGLARVAHAVHEVGHGDQFYRAVVTGDRVEDLRTPFAWSYLVSSEARARYEADRYAAQGEFDARLAGWDRATWARYVAWVRDDALTHYALTDGDRALAADILDGRAASVLAGAPCLDAVCAEALELVRQACAEAP